MNGTSLAATGAYLLLAAALAFWKNRHRHYNLALVAILLDIGIVLWLQTSRSAVQTALEFKVGMLDQAHIVVSTLALLLYFPLLYMILRLKNAQPDVVEGKLLQVYTWTFAAAFILRTAGFLFINMAKVIG
jgi:hypothetical protein